jgi:hypothetical protein
MGIISICLMVTAEMRARLPCVIIVFALLTANVALAASCKQAQTCEEAVRMWCDGYRRADADKDGIPCETLCRSKEEVDEIRKKIGC